MSIARPAIFLADGAAILAILTTAVVWLLSPVEGSFLFGKWRALLVLVPTAFCGFRLVLAVLFYRKPGGKVPGTTKATLGACVLFVLLFGAEQVLEFAGYERHFPPILIRGETANDSVEERAGIIADPRLLFRFKPEAEFRGRRVNRIGFLGREPDDPRTAGGRRVLCLGDSVSGQGVPPYSGYLHAQLTNEPPTQARWEAISMAVHGYTTSQGLRLFVDEGAALQPDFVVVLYGWNDHYLASIPDSNRMARHVDGLQGILYAILQRKRFGQFLLATAGPLESLGVRENRDGLRVPPDEYRRNLASLVDEIRGTDAIPILMTSPRAATISSLLVRNKQITSVEEGIRLHDEYNATLRDVAAQTETVMIDLAQIFADDEHQAFFSRDGIHFTPDEARRRIAEHVHGAVTDVLRGRSGDPARQ
jgi:lysophospholipase L1-like esterase